MLGQAEDARPRVAALRPPADRADLHKAESQRKQRRNDPPILIESGSQPYWMRESLTEKGDLEPGIVRQPPSTEPAPQRGRAIQSGQRPQSEVVRRLGVQAK